MLNSSRGVVNALLDWCNSCPALAGKVHVGSATAFRHSARKGVLAAVRSASGRAMDSLADLGCRAHRGHSLGTAIVDVNSLLIPFTDLMAANNHSRSGDFQSLKEANKFATTR